ncbi:uncharacterized protein LOC123206354 [Mangifera indica]|uniref:uncharacterized protein LOC123206354 n=1 Tax=Mangifera indica TaxID=29780 RepID=UPI001CF9BB55|nr:uncharacterized protein LOC123206354 [Mangifera indica]XP_044479487.1 uncharacterized protein LOC123206354 [Mangifera indica]
MTCYCCFDYRLNEPSRSKRERERKKSKRESASSKKKLVVAEEEEEIMEGKAKETWCMLRCKGFSQNNNNELINRTMLRFRPIAPKPASNGTVSGGLGVDNNKSLVSSKRSKRKYVGVRKNKGYKRKNRISPHEGVNKTVVTLQFFPEKTDSEKSDSNTKTQEPWCNIDDNNNNIVDPMVSSKGGGVVEVYDHELNHQIEKKGFGLSVQTMVVESWVTVESVTETSMDGRGLPGSTDFERMNNLKEDTCPGFISDGLNRVQWVNGAYKRMVMGRNNSNNGYKEGGESPEIMVELIMKEKLPVCVYSSFTTRVRVQYTWQKENYSKMVPCDVFRMDCGGFAWRLDIEAALSLGR